MKKTILIHLFVALLAIPTSFAQRSATNLIGLRSPFPAKVDVETSEFRPSFGAQNSNAESATTMFLYSNNNSKWVEFGILGSSNNYLGALGSAFIITEGSTPLIFGFNFTESVRFLPNGQVGIGITAPNEPSRLMVVRKDPNVTQQDSIGIIHAEATYPAGGTPLSDAPGISGKNTVNGSWGIGVHGKGSYTGVKGIAVPRSDFHALGGHFIASGGVASSTYNTGVLAEASTSVNRTAYGLRGLASSSGTTQTYGVHGTASGTSSVTYGIYGTTTSGTTRYAGYFGGNVTVTGTFSNPSDERLKRNARSLGGSLEKVMQLRPTEYEYLPERQKSMNLAEGKQIGFIAQELQKVLPNAVTKNVHFIRDEETPEDRNDRSKTQRKAPEKVEYLGINYISIIPLLTGAIQEQQKSLEQEKAKNQELERKLQALENRLASLEQKLGEQQNGSSTLESGIYLKQNTPNPFHQETRIEYVLPKNARSNAFIYISDASARVVRHYPLDASGLLVIKASELPQGVYTYSLVTDGKLLESRQMVLTK